MSAIRLLYSAISQMEIQLEDIYRDEDNYKACIEAGNAFLAKNPYTMYKCFYLIDTEEVNCLVYGWGEEELREWWAQDSYYSRFVLTRIEIVG